MKYVMFTNSKTGLKAPMFGSDHFCHCDFGPNMPGWEPTSAGEFCYRTMSCTGASETMGLSPDKDDAQVCALVMAGLESMLYVGQNLEKNIEDLPKKRRLTRAATRARDKGSHHDSH